jgi:hypothetical protein
MFAFIKDLTSKVQEMDDLVRENRIFKQRTVDIGVVSTEEAIEWGFTGPMLRASGVAWDLRKSQPYDAYHHLEFDVAMGTTGIGYARYLVRVAEIYESIKLIKQAISMMPSGDVMVDNHKIAPPRRNDMKGNMESLIHHFKLYTEGYRVPEGETYTAVEAPKGEFGVYLVSDGTNKPYRCKIRSAGLQFCKLWICAVKVICFPIFQPFWDRWILFWERLIDDRIICIFERKSSKAKAYIGALSKGSSSKCSDAIARFGSGSKRRLVASVSNSSRGRVLKHAIDPCTRGGVVLYDVSLTTRWNNSGSSMCDNPLLVTGKR